MFFLNSVQVSAFYFNCGAKKLFYFFLMLMSSVLFLSFCLTFCGEFETVKHSCFTYWFISFAIYFALFIRSDLEGIFLPTLMYIMEFKMFLFLPAFPILTVIKLIRNYRLSLQNFTPLFLPKLTFKSCFGFIFSRYVISLWVFQRCQCLRPVLLYDHLLIVKFLI